MRTIRVFRMQLLKSLGTVQFWAPFVLAFGAVLNAAQPISDITAHYSYPVNAFSAAFLLSDRLTAFTIFWGVFILFSEIPFRDNNQTLLLARSGKRPWIFGQVVYVIGVSVIYFACIFAFYCLILAARINFSALKFDGNVVKHGRFFEFLCEIFHRYRVHNYSFKSRFFFRPNMNTPMIIARINTENTVKQYERVG